MGNRARVRRVIASNRTDGLFHVSQPLEGAGQARVGFKEGLRVPGQPASRWGIGPQNLELSAVRTSTGVLQRNGDKAGDAKCCAMVKLLLPLTVQACV